jgi:hypothetical protein
MASCAHNCDFKSWDEAEAVYRRWVRRLKSAEGLCAQQNKSKEASLNVVATRVLCQGVVLDAGVFPAWKESKHMRDAFRFNGVDMEVEFGEMSLRVSNLERAFQAYASPLFDAGETDMAALEITSLGQPLRSAAAVASVV